ncbi:MAG: hypothetical protein ABIG43_03145 [Chloroflexota bacterium]
MKHKNIGSFPDGIMPPSYEAYKKPFPEVDGIPKYVVTKVRLKKEGGDQNKIEKYFNCLQELSPHIEAEYIHQVIDHIIKPFKWSTYLSFPRDQRSYKKLVKLHDLLEWLKDHGGLNHGYVIIQMVDGSDEYVEETKRLNGKEALPQAIDFVDSILDSFKNTRGRNPDEIRNYSLTLLVDALTRYANFNIESAMHQVEHILNIHPRVTEYWDYKKIKGIVYRNPYVDIRNSKPE